LSCNPKVLKIGTAYIFLTKFWSKKYRLFKKFARGPFSHQILIDHGNIVAEPTNKQLSIDGEAAMIQCQIC